MVGGEVEEANKKNQFKTKYQYYMYITRVRRKEFGAGGKKVRTSESDKDEEEKGVKEKNEHLEVTKVLQQ